MSPDRHPMLRPGETRPDWLITGFRQDGMYVVAGSAQLEEASITVDVRTEIVDRFAAPLQRAPASGQYTFTARTKRVRPHEYKDGETLTMAWSKHSYADALKHLFSVWAPAGGDPLGLAEGG